MFELYLQAELREKSWESEPKHIVKVLQVNSNLFVTDTTMLV